ncbi:hypothetical protein QTP88_016632 [Uroleucon formosanum]
MVEISRKEISINCSNSKKIFMYASNVVSSMKESDKKCSVLFDEVAIMKHIEYNKSLDLIEGFEDIGVLGRFPKYAKHALQQCIFSYKNINTYWSVKQKNGYTRNRTAKIFRTCFASICSFSLMKVSEKCNCETDQNEFLTIDVLSNIEVEVNNDTNENISDQEIENETNDTSSDEHSSSICSTLSIELKPKVTTLEECSIIYFAGYLAKRAIEHFNCTNCEKNLITQDLINEPNQLLITFKTFEHLNNTYNKGLNKPSSLQILICNTGLNVFSKMFEVIKSEKEIVKQMLKVAVLKLNK